MTHDEKTGRLLLTKDMLVDGAYYVGRCRNATIARWSADRNCFLHWRRKFDAIFIEEIRHPVDEDTFDVFRPVYLLEHPKFEIPLTEEPLAFAGNTDDLGEYNTEMWKRLPLAPEDP